MALLNDLQYFWFGSFCPKIGTHPCNKIGLIPAPMSAPFLLPSPTIVKKFHFFKWVWMTSSFSSTRFLKDKKGIGTLLSPGMNGIEHWFHWPFFCDVTKSNKHAWRHPVRYAACALRSQTKCVPLSMFWMLPTAHTVFYQDIIWKYFPMYMKFHPLVLSYCYYHCMK